MEYKQLESSLPTRSASAGLRAKYTKIATAVVLYWCVSISMVFLNKNLLSRNTLDAPLFVTAYQCVVAVAACCILGNVIPRKIMPSWLPKFPRVEPDVEIALKVLPLSMVFVGMIAFNNLCLKYLGIAFYNVGRSMTTVFNVILSYFILGDVTSPLALLACSVIISGFFLGVNQEKQGNVSEFSYLGIVFGLLASMCTALNAIFIKKILPVVHGDIILIIVLNETSTIFNSPLLFSLQFWFFMTLAGIFGVLIGLVSMFQIKVTSPLTHNISGTAKACAQTILALNISGVAKSWAWWSSNVLVLGGSLAYTPIRFHHEFQIYFFLDGHFHHEFQKFFLSQKEVVQASKRAFTT